MRLRELWLAGLLSVLATLGQAQTVSNPDSWQSPLRQDHPLVGRIWSSRTADFVSVNELLDAVNEADYFLLGEKHDNADHHTLELQFLQNLIAGHQIATLAMEMLDADQQPLVAELPGRQFSDLQSLQQYLNWDTEGWDWDFYGPLIAAAQAGAVPVRAANISTVEMRQVYGQPLDSTVAAMLDAAAAQRLNEEIDSSHCQLLPASQFPAMVRVQQSRDYRMAQTLLATPDGVPGVRMLIAGNFHVRRDLAVPRYLQALSPGLTGPRLVALALLEVDAESTNPQEYQQAFSATPPYDFIWFTPALTDEDYCSALQEQQ